MQDAYLKLWERWDRVSGMDDPTGFLFRTAIKRLPQPVPLCVRRDQKTDVARAGRSTTSQPSRTATRSFGYFGRSAPPSGPRSTLRPTGTACGKAERTDQRRRVRAERLHAEF